MDTPLVSKEIYKKRIKICTLCPAYDSSLHRCRDCGCFLLLKAILKPTKCPRKKWSDDELV